MATRRALAPAALGALLALLGAPLGPARAADPCDAAPGDTPARIAAVDDRLDIRLDDGRTIRLAGLAPPPSATDGPDRALTARRALETWAAAGPVTVRALSASADRWGRVPALLFRPDAAERSAGTSLLDQGLVRAKPEAAVHGCFSGLAAAEDRARAARRGLWADPGTAALRAGDADALAGASGGFAEIEGFLQVHAARGGTLYLTLGRERWGFAAVLTRRDAARFAKEGLDVADYVGTPVRLRGDLDDRFGARMRLTDPDQIQSLEPGSLAPEPAPPR